jgi:hypothetical protein
MIDPGRPIISLPLNCPAFQLRSHHCTAARPRRPRRPPSGAPAAPAAARPSRHGRRAERQARPRSRAAAAPSGRHAPDRAPPPRPRHAPSTARSAALWPHGRAHPPPPKTARPAPQSVDALAAPITRCAPRAPYLSSLESCRAPAPAPRRPAAAVRAAARGASTPEPCRALPRARGRRLPAARFPCRRARAAPPEHPAGARRPPALTH